MELASLRGEEKKTFTHLGKSRRLKTFPRLANPLEFKWFPDFLGRARDLLRSATGKLVGSPRERPQPRSA